MIDRKTKSIDASVELLEDRIKQINLSGYFLFFLSTIVFFLGYGSYFFTRLIGLPILIVLLGLFGLLGSIIVLFQTNHFNLLIFLKRKEDKHK